jgi:hypothetical protein
MTPNERRVLRLLALGLVAVLLAVAQSLLRKRHPMRWARRNAHEVVDPLEEAAVDLLGLGAAGQEPSEAVADPIPVS